MNIKKFIGILNQNCCWKYFQATFSKNKEQQSILFQKSLRSKQSDDECQQKI